MAKQKCETEPREPLSTQPNNPSSASIAACCIPGSTCEYRSSVMVTVECPRSSERTLGCTARRKSSVAQVWRRCGAGHRSGCGASWPASTMPGSRNRIGDCRRPLCQWEYRRRVPIKPHAASQAPLLVLASPVAMQSLQRLPWPHPCLAHCPLYPVTSAAAVPPEWRAAPALPPARAPTPPAPER